MESGNDFNIKMVNIFMGTKEQGIMDRLRLVDNEYILYERYCGCGLIRELHVYGLVAPK